MSPKKPVEPEVQPEVQADPPLVRESVPAPGVMLCPACLINDESVVATTTVNGTLYCGTHGVGALDSYTRPGPGNGPRRRGEVGWRRRPE